MFDYDRTLHYLEKIGKMSHDKEQHFFDKLFHDDSFIDWLFAPEASPDLADQVTKMYAQFVRPKSIKALVDFFNDSDLRDFNRSHATLLYSISNVAIKTANDKIDEIKKARDDGRINRNESEDMNDKIIRYNKRIAELLKIAKHIIKKDAKELSSNSGISKTICQIALYSVPQTKYVDRFKLGRYLSNLLDCIYSEVEAEKFWPGSSARWRIFFKIIFGKENTINVATFILLEGVHRIDKYENSHDVKSCWNSLTMFALRELEDAPDALRSQMVEIYIKRLDKMFANSAYDIRFNLLGTDTSIFPKLAETVKTYAPKISAIMNRGKEIS
jgi:uncharacterized protein YqkB